MEFTAKTISEFLKGEIVGNPDEKVSEISKIEEGKNGSLSFLSNPKYTKYLYSTESSIVLVNKSLKLENEVRATLILVEDAYEAFASLLQLYAQALPRKTGIDNNTHVSSGSTYGSNIYLGAFAFIGENVKIGDNVSIYPQVFIGDNVIIGNDTTLFPGVKVYHDCTIGSNCTVHAGSVIGSDGFGFAPQQESEFKKIPQIGNVVIEDFVEIGANVTIDRATIGSTIIRKGVKLDNLIQVAHNVEIGENTVIAAQTGISGSTKIGRDNMIAGQVGLVGHIKIADGVKIGAQSGVTNSVDKEGEIILGSPAYNISEKRREYAVSRQLPTLYKRITELEKEIQKLRESEK